VASYPGLSPWAVAAMRSALRVRGLIAVPFRAPSPA